jgi:CheY-like chemotaxis protein
MAKRSALDILIVDDQLDIPLTLSAMLRELAEVKISVAKDGREAMIALGSKRFDLLFLDLQLPIMTGEEILDAIAAGEGNIRRPAHIIVMSAGSRLQELQERLSADVIDGLLEKPFQYTDLQVIIADVIAGDFLSDI